jgi:GT2 family glycosyltransferase/SAM-dependent methyltransferase
MTMQPTQSDYDENYYRSHCGGIPYERSEPHWGRFFDGIAKAISEGLGPKSVFDAGCAKGFLVEALRKRDIEAFGRDFSEYAINEIPAPLRQFCAVGSIADPIEGSYDLITCIEVLEHMTPEDGERAIGNLCSAAPVILFSSSPDDFNEPTHVNVRPPLHWLRLFAKHGFGPRSDYDPSYLCPWAMLLEWRDAPPEERELKAYAKLVATRREMAHRATEFDQLLKSRITPLEAEIGRLSQSSKEGRDEIARLSQLQREAQVEADRLSQAHREAQREIIRLSHLHREAQKEAEHLLDAHREAHDGLVRLSQANREALEEIARLSAIERSTTWRATRPMRRVVDRTRLVREQVFGFSHRSSPEIEGPGVARFKVAQPAGGYSGWWLLTLKGSQRPDWRDATLVATMATAQRLSLQLHGAPSLGNGRIIRIPNGTVDVFLTCRVSEARPDFSELAVSLKRISKSRALLSIVRSNPATMRSAYALLRTQGARSAIGSIMRPAIPVATDSYQTWIATYESIGRDEQDLIRRHIAQLPARPTFSILVPVYETPLEALREMVASVRAQIYPHWELCIADDCSKAPHIRAFLEDQAGEDARIKLVFRQENGNISACSNSALELATGAYLALVDHDDVIAPHALVVMADAVAKYPQADIFYSDEDKIDERGNRYDPYFKPDFNQELLYGQNFINHLGVYRTSLVKQVGGFRLGYEGSQDYDLVLRLVAATRGPVVHVPHILYHWRLFPGAQTFSSTQLDKATLAARRAIGEHFAARGQIVIVEAGIGAYHRVRRKIEAWPRVSVIIPTRDHADTLANCIEGLIEKTDYSDIEIIIADNDSSEPETKALFERIEALGGIIVPCPGPFNYSKINNDAIKRASGDYILLLNNDISMIEPGWLKEMAQFMQDGNVGAVGAKLLYPDGTLQHGGVTLGILGVAGHTHLGAPGDFPGYFGQLGLARDVSCATAACLLLRKSVFDQVGGLDETNLKVAFNDVDLCIRIRQLGYRIIWTPHACLTHHESKSRGADTSGEKRERFLRETKYMRNRWSDILDNDPFLNPNLSLLSNDPEIAFPPRVKWPWR